MNAQEGRQQRQVCGQICYSARRNNDFTLWCRKSIRPTSREYLLTFSIPVHFYTLLNINPSPATKKSVFDLPTGPAHIVLYQKNIEAVCSSEAEVRHQIRLTVIHELGHYFGMDENQLKDV